MNTEDLKKTIDNGFEKISEVNTSTKGDLRDAVEETLNLLDNGKLSRGACIMACKLDTSFQDLTGYSR